MLNNIGKQKYKVNAVIVSYNNYEMLSILIGDLREQTYPICRIIVVDNSGNKKKFKKYIKGATNLSYIWMEKNYGSAGGYYKGLQEGMDSCDFLITLDDDVRVENDFVDKMIQCFKGNSRKYDLFAVRGVSKNSDILVPMVLDLVPWRGTMFCSDLVKKIGLPIRELFLYGDDMEYSLRFKRAGYVCIWAPGAYCTENRTEGKTQVKVGNRKYIIYANPYQYYYAFRNQVFIFIKHNEIKLMLKTVLYGIKVSCANFLFKRPMWEKNIIALVNGIIDGCSGKIGFNNKYIP